MPPSRQPPDRIVTPEEFPHFEGRVVLRCRACGKTGHYAVGRIFIDPEQLTKTAPGKIAYEDAVSFTGYFHCRRCGAGGPWEFPPRTVAQIQLLVLAAIGGHGVPGVALLRSQLFDGTFTRTATEAEAHLRGLIAANPNDAFLWNRLGNLYDHAEQNEQAFDAFTRAIELNPQDVESHYTLGCYCMKQRQSAKAAEHFTQVLRHARTAPRRQPGLVEQMVRDTLERLWDLHQESGGAIEFLPLLDVPPRPAGDPGPLHVFVRELDLGDERTWDALATMYLTGRLPGMPTPPSRPVPLPPGAHLPAPKKPDRIGRNQPCPCGSGKKYKQCCGRAR